jgi:hypothetical protein
MGFRASTADALGFSNGFVNPRKGLQRIYMLGELR